jgi:hypothetical protein
MKNTKKYFVLLIFIVAFSAFITFAGGIITGGIIKGKILPADGASQVWAISSSDTLKAAISQGIFEISNVKQGTYKIYIDAIDPYRDVVRDGIQVSENGTVDLGEIQLSK